jgi:DNA-binding NtrC family response regulator
MLLRALEAGEIRPLGDDQVQHVKVRVVAATNRRLDHQVASRHFREDLFYRLAVVRLHIPSLRERVDDIELLAQHFAATLGMTPLPQTLIARLAARGWRGNVRELRNAVEAYAALGALPDEAGGRVQVGGLDLALRGAVDVERPYPEQKDELVERFTAFYLRALLERTGGNQTAAARLAGLTRGYLRKLLERHGLLGGD